MAHYIFVSYMVSLMVKTFQNTDVCKEHSVEISVENLDLKLAANGFIMTYYFRQTSVSLP